MFPTIPIGSGHLGSYNVILLTGVVFGWIAYILEEDGLFGEKDASARMRVFLGATFSYVIIAACCLQGAVIFHFFFDDIPEHASRRLTWAGVLLAHPLKTSKVLYGAVFCFPLGVFLVSFWNVRGRFLPLLNRKAFILFIVLGFARVGCFANGCCYGVRSELFGVRFPVNSAAAWEHMQRGYTRGGFMAPPSLPVIPTQAISAVFLFCLAYWTFRGAQQGRRAVFATGVLTYAVFRFLIEFLRDDLERAYFGPLSASQWISVFIFTLFAAWLFARKKGLFDRKG